MKNYNLFLLIICLFCFIISGCSKKEGNLSGIIYDKDTGSLIKGAKVVLQPLSEQVESDEAGTFVLKDIKFGDYTLVVVKDGYFPNNIKVKIDKEKSEALKIYLTPIPPDPISSFSYAGTNETPAVVTFFNNSKNANSYFWDFGDNTTSTEVNPTKTYQNFGEFIIRLIATNTLTGKSDTSFQKINILPSRVSLHSLSIDKISFRDTRGNSWDFGDGPDLYVTIEDLNGEVLYNGLTTKLVNASIEDLPINIEIWPELTFYKTSWKKLFVIKIWDEDFLGRELIAMSKPIKFGEFAESDFPGIVIMNGVKGRLELTLNLRWE